MNKIKISHKLSQSFDKNSSFFKIDNKSVKNVDKVVLHI